MKFHFSIRHALKESWELFKKHIPLFLTLSVVMFLLQIISRGKHVDGAIMALAGIASFIWSFVFMRIVLSLVQGKNLSYSFETFKSALPSFKNFFYLIAVGIVTAIVVIGGFIMLIIPGFYFIFRLGFSNISYIDRQGKIMEAVKHSWGITKGEVIWTVILSMFVMIGLVLLGLVAFGIGAFVTYPIAFIFFIKLYQALNAFHNTKPTEAPVEVLSQ